MRRKIMKEKLAEKLAKEKLPEGKFLLKGSTITFNESRTTPGGNVSEEWNILVRKNDTVRVKVKYYFDSIEHAIASIKDETILKAVKEASEAVKANKDESTTE
jgi:hypothetical protein